MTKKTKEILSFYESDSPGVLSNLARILNHGYLGGTGKLVILPVDQGFEHGPVSSFSKNLKGYDPDYHFKLAIESGCNAYSAPLGFLQAGAKKFAGQIPLILKLNSSDSLYKSNSAPLPAVTASVEQALELGCQAVGFTIYPGSEQRNKMYEQIAHIGEKARQYGLAIVIWSYPRGGSLSKKGETAVDVISYSAHIATQLGAHIIKVKPPVDHIENESFKENFKNTDTLADRTAYVLQSSFQGKRIVIFSGGPAKETKPFLKEVEELAKGGSFGSIVGRNAFQRPFDESVNLLRDIMNIYKKYQ